MVNILGFASPVSPLLKHAVPVIGDTQIDMTVFYGRLELAHVL